MEKSYNDKLQALCRYYLIRLRKTAKKHGLLPFIDNIIISNKNNKCAATEDEVDMLSRMVEEERVERSEIPDMLGKSYRKCIEDGDFSAVRKLKRVGIYSRNSVLLHKMTHYDT